MKKIISLAFLLLLSISGCTAGSKPTSSPTASNMTAIQSTEALPTEQVTITTNHITSTATEEPSRICGLSNDMPNIPTEGRIVYFRPEEGLHFYDVANGEERVIPNTYNIFAPLVASSPDHKRIAYYDFSGETGWVISFDGNRIEPRITGRLDGYFYGWLDNDKVIFVDRARFDGSIITLDIYTGNISKTVTELHDVYNLGANRWFAGGDWPTVIFNSSLNRMVYMSGELPGESPGKWGYIMRELETHKLLWFRTSNDLVVQPKWSPDGSFAAIVIANDSENGDQIHVIDQEGMELQIIDTDTRGINIVEWSPDGRWLSYGGKDILGVYDFSLEQLHKFVLSDEIWNIVWSPYGDQIAIQGFLVDLSINCMFPLKSNDPWGPLAWLVEEP